MHRAQVLDPPPQLRRQRLVRRVHVGEQSGRSFFGTRDAVEQRADRRMRQERLVGVPQPADARIADRPAVRVDVADDVDRAPVDADIPQRAVTMRDEWRSTEELLDHPVEQHVHSRENIQADQPLADVDDREQGAREHHQEDRQHGGVGEVDSCRNSRSSARRSKVRRSQPARNTR